jgi:hypothetical protein
MFSDLLTSRRSEITTDEGRKMTIKSLQSESATFLLKSLNMLKYVFIIRLFQEETNKQFYIML